MPTRAADRVPRQGSDATAVDLRAPPFVRDRAALDAIRTTTRGCQRFGARRARGRRRRDPLRVGARSAARRMLRGARRRHAFARPSPLEQQTWMLSVTRERVVTGSATRCRSRPPEHAFVVARRVAAATRCTPMPMRRRRIAVRTARSPIRDARPHRLRADVARDAGVHRRARRATRPTRSGSPSIRRSTRWGSPAGASTCCATTAFPSLKVDRGGQVTYHGPGQLVAYLLCRPAARAARRPRRWSGRIEAAVVEWLDSLGIAAYGKPAAPGVYVARDGGRGEDRRAGAQGAQRLHLSRPRGERRDGPRAVRRHRPVRLSGPRRHAARRPRRRDDGRARPAPSSRRSSPRDLPTPTMTIDTPAAAAANARRRQAQGRRRRPRASRSRSSPAERAEEAGLDPRARARRRRASTRSSRSCASTSCTRCARKRRARTSASASARARRRS